VCYNHPDNERELFLNCMVSTIRRSIIGGGWWTDVQA
jgi:hypothetical protein